MKTVSNRLIPFGRYSAINLFGIIFYKKGRKIDQGTLRHEAIHTAQMRELLYLPFYLAYVVEWLIYIIFKGMSPRKAYFAISFEREAYRNQHDPFYLSRRKFFSQWRR